MSPFLPSFFTFIFYFSTLYNLSMGSQNRGHPAAGGGGQPLAGRAGEEAPGLPQGCGWGSPGRAGEDLGGSLEGSPGG